ncbi:MAG TPA: DUF2330 domain-containing protein [Actinophytocola sp.]|jgi:hypothetical protein|nr:DUF2330 domain-containing protein [Actinophytocola sp.]
MRRAIAKLAVLPLVALGMLITGPGVAGACACGAILADQRLRAVQETALVHLTEGTEAVTLNVTTQTQATQAAFLMPVPARAKFELADATVFTELDEISRPRVEYRTKEVDAGSSGGAAPGAESNVTVTDHTDVGPFEVAQLTGTDSAAVADWLDAHHFTLPPELADALTPYLAEGWLVVAVQLTPDTAGKTFAEGLPPMRMTFRTDEPVYPVRLSATAEYSQPLRLYVLADHRMDASNPAPPGQEPEATFAGRLRPADLADRPVLAKLVTGGEFLTRYDAAFQPSEITDDIHLTRAANDEPYRAVVTETRYVTRSSATTVVMWAVTIGIAVLFLGGAALLLSAAFVLRRRRSSHIATSGGRPRT